MTTTTTTLDQVPAAHVALVAAAITEIAYVYDFGAADAARILTTDPKDAAAIESSADDADSYDDWLCAYADRHDLVIRKEGIVPRGGCWEVSDGYTTSPDRSVDPEDDPDYNSVDPSDWGNDDGDDTVSWDVTWTIVVVPFLGQDREISREYHYDIQPDEPDCRGSHDHAWRSPSWLGGCDTNPGVWGSSHGGVSCRVVCLHCGVYRTTDTGGTNPGDGTRRTEVAYEDADEESLAWVVRRATDADEDEDVEAIVAIMLRDEELDADGAYAEWAEAEADDDDEDEDEDDDDEDED